ncbi:hypothetical protein CPC08DRAFT_814348 [Agrocybe pediades]|nr:hypothetical protein CPC08DRAFT_814348 [Agrocybe pediades]
MPQNWTSEKIAHFKADRDKLRRDKGLCPFDQLNNQEKKATIEAQKADLLQDAEANLRLTAWSLGHQPLHVYAAPYSGFLELPRDHMAASGCDRIKFEPGTNLNAITFNYYNEAVDSRSYCRSQNYVSDGSIHPKRHEYLGPSPKVGGYRFAYGTAQVLFWDDYLDSRWVGKRKWNIELEFDSTVDSWRVLEHSM